VAETKEQKAARYITERRLTVTRADPDGIVLANCRGDGGEIYTLGWDPAGRGRWGCTCEANHDFHRECSHIVALRMVVSRSRK
jgi:hypothetical protein